jgi:hypothetical protein
MEGTRFLCYDGVMKKTRVFFFFVVCCTLCGCAREDETMLPSVAEQTLKSLIEQKNTESIWTIEVDPPQKPAPAAAVRLTPNNVFALRGESRAETVYPQLEGFGSLNTSLLDAEKLALINAFCEAVIAHNREKAESLMNPQNAFLLTVFFDDIKNVTFTKRYIIGQPGMRGSLWQVPVRFYASGGWLGAWLFFRLGETLVIDQIIYGEIMYGNAEQP